MNKMLHLRLLLPVFCVMAALMSSAGQAQNVVISQSNFPDAVFRLYLNSYADTDHDGALSSAEIQNVKTIPTAVMSLMNTTWVRHSLMEAPRKQLCSILTGHCPECGVM